MSTGNKPEGLQDRSGITQRKDLSDPDD
jgi:hypothetical protein